MNKKSIIGLVLAALIGLGTYLNGGDLGQALKLAFDKEAAKVECAKLLEAE